MGKDLKTENKKEEKIEVLSGTENDDSKKESKKDDNIQKDLKTENKKEEKIEVLIGKLENTATKPEIIKNEKGLSKVDIVEIAKSENKDSYEEEEIESTNKEIDDY